MHGRVSWGHVEVHSKTIHPASMKDSDKPNVRQSINSGMGKHEPFSYFSLTEIPESVSPSVLVQVRDLGLLILSLLYEGPPIRHEISPVAV